ncbi:MAG: hypothetical protein IKU54_03710 [Oscillospiraceae bacterium]|nr:hypothetical protein [Oscillospiraceae bacterium]
MENKDVVFTEYADNNLPALEDVLAQNGDAYMRPEYSAAPGPNKTKLKKILPLIVIAVLGLCFLLFSGTSGRKYVIYDFNLEAYGESLNGNNSEMLKDCYFKVDFDKGKISMHKRGKTYKGKITLEEYNYQVDGFLYTIEWNKVPEIVGGFSTDSDSLMLHTTYDDEILIYMTVDGYIQGTYVELDAYYYCY